MSRYKELLNDKKLMRGLYALTLISAVLVLMLVIKGPEKSGKLIADDEGRIVGIHRSGTMSVEHYDLTLTVKDEGGDIERDIDLTLQSRRNESKSEGIPNSNDREAIVNSGIDRIINEIEYSDTGKIVLPTNLPDGTPIEWRKKPEDLGGNLFTVSLIYFTIAALMVASKLKEDDNGKAERRSILKGLPRFCNQLFLMMNAGLILSDAFDTITGSYKGFERAELSFFEKELAELNEATDHHRISTAEVINEYAVKHDVKELIRIATILTENEKRGSDVIESLERESRYLWDERKIVARECGKMIDTKMSYPLGLLLIVLIVVTMAPALLNM